MYNKLPTIKEPLGEPAHLVVAEVNVLERDVARREDLSGQQLPSNVLLAELLPSDRRVSQSSKTNGNQHLYVVSEGQYGEVAGKDDVVAVDPRGVLLVETA